MSDFSRLGYYMGEMQPQSDAQLLRAYAELGSEPAFTELVQRHTNLVYSAALRQVESSDVAAEIAQKVFLSLAHTGKDLAPRLTAKASLAGWLCRSARNQALNHRRDEFRRATRERHAMEQILPLPDAAPDWEKLRPVLDAAMAELDETDYDALVLRFYQNQNFRTVGAAIGVSDDTAQKRVTRALEKLRDLFAQRGIRTSAGALGVVITANAVQAAPAGLALTISATAIAGTAVTTSTVIAATTKTIAMTTLQKTLVAATVAVLTGVSIYKTHQTAQLREQAQMLQQQQAQLTGQIQQFQHERDVATQRLSELGEKLLLHLPAPQIQLSAGTLEDLQATNLYERFKVAQPKLTVEQLESYLQANGRNAASLLAAYRKSGDIALLREATEKYPDNPLVAFEAVMRKDATPDERRQWLDVFKKSAPDNALANYLSALDYFKTGQANQAVQELMTASGKSFQDFTSERYQDDAEAYLASGYSIADAKTASGMQLLLPQLAQIKELGLNMIELAKSYQQAGDSGSAQAALQMAIYLGQRYSNPSPGEPLVSQLVGIAIENFALKVMDANSPYGNTGLTVQDRINQLNQQQADLKERNRQAESIFPQMTEQDWINYRDRWLTFGEQNAIQWLVNKYGQQ